jgi:hypothetical protein
LTVSGGCITARAACDAAISAPVLSERARRVDVLGLSFLSVTF